jgi:GT2 family glycosyltransferase
MPAFSVIIPHWNRREHLDTCLSALRHQQYQDFEVILVDNGSSDGSQAYVREHFPEVRLLELGENQGFTGACNAGYNLARGDYVVLLNNDTEADPGWLAALDGAFARHPHAGILASKLLLFDRRNHFHAAGDYYRVDGIPGNRGVWEQDSGQYDREEQVFGACAAAAAYRREMVSQIGFLDDDFYFSCEDVDIAWRANLAGWQVVYVPRAIVYHKLKATGGSVTGSYYDGRNFLYLIWKNYPGPLLRRYWPLIVRAQLQISADAVRAWRGAAARARLRGQIAGLLGLPKMWRKRRQIQRYRRLSTHSVTARLTPVDAPSRRR